MCGIAGFYNAKVDQGQIHSLMSKLHHRGPDDQRFYTRNDVGLVHTRLSIIELSERGAQPYRFENLVLVFNGEIYNYQEVREELKKYGYSFQSNSDTEVLIKSFHCWREQCVDHFLGMFAFGIYDESTDEIFLFRDRVGVKPLYYSFQQGVLFFASELKALSVFNISREIDLDAVSLYFRFGFIPHHLSIYKSVSKLEAGHYLKISRQGMMKKKYWKPNHEIIQNRKENDWIEELETLLISAFRYRMVSDVPVGVFLSGGVDSSLLTAILQKHYGGIHTFTIGFEESDFDESTYARKVAEHLKSHHVQKVLKLEEARYLLTNFYSVYDEPFADTSGIPTACVTHLAKDYGMKVVLSADGGDELFGGYTHYQNALSLFAKFTVLPSGIRHALSKSMRVLAPPMLRRKIYPLNVEHKTYAFEEIIAAESPSQFFEAFIANQSLDEIAKIMGSASVGTMGFLDNGYGPLQAMMAWDFHFYLPDDLLVKVDRATMFHSVECREPFLDHRVVELAARIPTDLKIKEGKGKYLLQKLLSRYVPQEYFERKKQGFSIPIFAWFRKELDEMFDNYLSTEKLGEVPFFDVKEIQREHKKYRYYKKHNKQYNIEKMWRILSFMLWWEKHVKHGA